ncbi:hypothetical protein ACFXHA_06900 [Nocardia sp. NPDC059240]|uniref:hypothetical protein n=1 Tax=Nocardia sp. NPDC059240 TaxID=3346786 RepID=UPI0036A698DE
MSSHEDLRAFDDRETIERLVSLLRTHLPSDWKRLVQKYRALGSVSQAPAMVWNRDNAGCLWRPPGEAVQLLEQLRHNMYRPERGAWLSMDLVLRSSNTVDISYFWHEDAGWGDQRPGRTAFHEELEIHPRSGGFIPDWFQTGLEQVR